MAANTPVAWQGSLRIVSGLYLYDWPNQRFIRKYDLQQAGCGATRIFNPPFPRMAVASPSRRIWLLKTLSTFA